jgi:hypothetical protein
MSTKRKRHSPEFEAKVAIEAIKGMKTARGISKPALILNLFLAHNYPTAGVHFTFASWTAGDTNVYTLFRYLKTFPV